MKTPNIFLIYLNSVNSQQNTTPSNMSFNIGSVLGQAPNIINFEKQAYCKIKVRYFSIKRTAAQLTTADISTLLINMMISHPNSIRSTSMTSTEPSNVRTSNIIGVVNLIIGDISIQILDQDYTEFTGLDQTMPVEMLLEVCFDDDPAIVNDNSGKLNTNGIEYNLNSGY